MRATIRFNEKEQLQLDMLKQYLHEEDISKVIKFGLETALHHLNYVTSIAASSNYNVIFTSKRKTQKLSRKIY